MKLIFKISLNALMWNKFGKLIILLNFLISLSFKYCILP